MAPVTRSKSATPSRARGNLASGRGSQSPGGNGGNANAEPNANGPPAPGGNGGAAAAGQLAPQVDAAALRALFARAGSVAAGIGDLSGDLQNAVGRIGTLSATLDATDATIRQEQERQEQLQERQEQEQGRQEQRRQDLDQLVRFQMRLHTELTEEVGTLSAFIIQFEGRVEAQRNADRARIAALEEQRDADRARIAALEQRDADRSSIEQRDARIAALEEEVAQLRLVVEDILEEEEAEAVQE